MRAGLHTLAVGLTALGLAACSSPGRLAVKIERIPCPPAPLQVECPSLPEIPKTEIYRPGEKSEWEEKAAAVVAICKAALRAWEEAHAECADHP